MCASFSLFSYGYEDEILDYEYDETNYEDLIKFGHITNDPTLDEGWSSHSSLNSSFDDNCIVDDSLIDSSENKDKKYRNEKGMSDCSFDEETVDEDYEWSANSSADSASNDDFINYNSKKDNSKHDDIKNHSFDIDIDSLIDMFQLLKI